MYRPLQLLVRKVAFPVITNLGLQRILWQGNDSILVLMYHGVNASSDTSLNGRHLSARRFERHLRYLKETFEVLPLNEVFDAVGTERHGRPRICITFDDGFENNLTYAVPLLSKHGLPATFFVSSVCATGETDILWPDAIDLIVKDEKAVEVAGLRFERSYSKFFNAGIGKNLRDHIKEQDCNSRDGMMSELSERYDLRSLKASCDPEQWRLMTASQVKELSEQSGISIGSHCHNHYNLAHLTLENAKRELSYSRQLLEECIGKPVTSIAFPDGSYNDRVKQLAYEVGYDGVCAVSFKLPDDPQDRRILRRSAVSATTNYSSNILHFHRNFNRDGN